MTRMKVKDLPYKRVTIEEISEALDSAILKIKSATSAQDLIEAREIVVKKIKTLSTMSALSNARFTLNTKDEFYQSEKDYYDEITPIAEVKMLEYGNAILASSYIEDLKKLINPLIIKKYELQSKATSEKIVAELQEDNALITKYVKFVSELTYEFRGEKLTLNALRKYMQDNDRQTRKDAYNALGKTLEANSNFIDDIFDKMVKNRDVMGKKMGYKNFIELGYARMERMCYDEETVKTFRENVLTDIVPVVKKLKGELAEKLGINEFKLYDNDTYFESEPKPILSAEGILQAGSEMYNDMSKETGEFINMMMEAEAFDVFPREGKWTGGYMTDFCDYDQPFIFANFNGTTADVDVITHEAGHAFAGFLSSPVVPFELGLGGMETAETHSMSMEFFAWKYMDKFFGSDEKKYRYKHLFDCLSFIPYGTIVDYFQHFIYENPEMSPAERKACWKKLEEEFRPYMNADGIEYLEQGTRWQYQNHIFELPFYYIDYCLAQSVAIQFLAFSLKDYDKALKVYIDHCRRGGAYVFTDLVKIAGLKSPFEKGALKEVAEISLKVLQNLAK